MEEKKEILKDHGSLVATAIMDLLAGIEGIVFLIVLGANIPSSDEYGRTVFTVIFWSASPWWGRHRWRPRNPSSVRRPYVPR